MSAGHDFPFPRGSELNEILALEEGHALEDLFTLSLNEPMQQVLKRPRKNLRGQLLTIGFMIASARTKQVPSQHQRLLEQSSLILESLHTGSLVIDDIEDGSKERRGAPTIHMIYGVPVALNAGNWLYFLPFRWIEDMQLLPEQRQALTRECHKTLLQAHYGQALDVGVPFDSLPQSRIPSVVMTAVELKTGALSGLALKFGAIIAHAEPVLLSTLETFGRRFGVALQMFDDIGNFVSNREPEKLAEDFKLRRLNFISAVTAEYLSASDFSEFTKQVANLPTNIADLRAYLTSHGVINTARDKAKTFLKNAISELDSSLQLNSDELELIRKIQDQLVTAYE